MKAGVAKLNKKSWEGELHYIESYFNFSAVGKWLEEQGIYQVPEGLHDDFGMTAVMMSVDPQSVRTAQRIAAGNFRINGIDLAPAEKTIQWGKRIINYRAEAAAKAIRTAVRK